MCKAMACRTRFSGLTLWCLEHIAGPPQIQVEVAAPRSCHHEAVVYKFATLRYGGENEEASQ
jgi:hypothetical protein